MSDAKWPAVSGEPFRPDWDRIEALQESLREHMAEIHRLRAAVAQPAASGEPVAWLNLDSMKAMAADEKIAWLEAGRADLVDGYTTPLYTAQPAPALVPDTAAILGAVARGWCHPKTAGTTMDPDLAIAIAAEVFALYSTPAKEAPPTTKSHP